MTRYKFLTIVFLPLLLAFSTADRANYLLEINTRNVDVEGLFQEIEAFVIDQGFSIDEKIIQTVPTHSVLLTLHSGVQFQGGITIELVLNKDESHIALNAYRLHGGCSQSDNIEAMDTLINDLERRLEAKFGFKAAFKRVL